MTNISENDIAQILQRSFGTRIAEREYAILGNFATKAVQVSDTDQQGLVYVHGLGDDKTSSFVAFNSVGITEIYGRPVEVEKTTFGYKIVGLAPEDGTYMEGVNITSQNPVFRSQLMFGGIAPQPTADGTVIVMGSVFRVGDAHYVTKDTTSGDLTDGSTNDTGASAINLPTTSGQAKLVMVQVDPTDGTISYKQSSEFNASFTLYQIGQDSNIPAPDTDNFLCGYVRLTKGITALTWDHIINVPDIVTMAGASGTVSASGSAFNNYLVRWDGTTGTLIQTADVIVSDNGGMSITPLTSATVALTLESGDGSLTYNLLEIKDGSSVLQLSISANGTLYTGSGRIKNTTRVTTTYTILVTDEVIFCNTTGGAFTVTLPSGVEGQSFRIINSGSNTLTIDPDGDDIDGSSSNATLATNTSRLLTYNATDGWY